MPLNAWMQRAQTWLLLALGRRDAAMAVFQRTLAANPRDAHALASRAHLHAQAGQHAQAAQDLAALCELQPAVAVHWFNLGFVRDALGQVDDAVKAFTQAADLDPKLDRAWYGLGLGLLQQGRLDEAIVALKRNTELQPMSPYGWTQLARTYARAAQPGKARKVVDHLRRFEPRVAEALDQELKLDAVSP